MGYLGDRSPAVFVESSTIGREVLTSDDAESVRDAIEVYSKEYIEDMFRGQVAFFAMESVDTTQWLPITNQAVSRTTYAKLFAKIGTTYGAGDGSTTFNLPPVAGRFIRGVGVTGSDDSDRVLGSLQGDGNRSHTHGASSDVQGNHSHTVSGYGQYNNDNRSLTFQSTSGTRSTTTSTAGEHSHNISITADGINESRPVNIALLPCIKF